MALRVNLDVLTEHVEEIGEALPKHLRYDGDTIFLRGDTSEYIGIEDERIIHNQFPKAEIKNITNAGHWLHAENPAEFFKEVMQFIG